MPELYGYAALAREINARLDISPPVRTTTVYRWHERRPRNFAGRQFPLPADDQPVPSGKQGRPSRYRWELEPVLDWIRAGVSAHPEPGWRFPSDREQILNTAG
jgi:hypothetical protein